MIFVESSESNPNKSFRPLTTPRAALCSERNFFQKDDRRWRERKVCIGIAAMTSVFLLGSNDALLTAHNASVEKCSDASTRKRIFPEAIVDRKVRNTLSL